MYLNCQRSFRCRGTDTNGIRVLGDFNFHADSPDCTPTVDSFDCAGLLWSHLGALIYSHKHARAQTQVSTYAYTDKTVFNTHAGNVNCRQRIWFPSSACDVYNTSHAPSGCIHSRGNSFFTQVTITYRTFCKCMWWLHSQIHRGRYISVDGLSESINLAQMFLQTLHYCFALAIYTPLAATTWWKRTDWRSSAGLLWSSPHDSGE